MTKATICIGENKGADQLRSRSFAVTAKLIIAFATRIVQFLYILNPNFPVSSHLLVLYRLVCVGPSRKPHCWFSRVAAHKLLPRAGETDPDVRLGALRLAQSLVLDEGNFGVVQELNEVVRGCS